MEQSRYNGTGMHVAVLAAIIMPVLIGLGFWRRQAFYFSILLIFFFIVLTGGQASTIRAGIMVSFFLLAQQLGRANVSIRGIVFAASLMLINNPLILKSDIGFQLSFLAVIGIIYLNPFLKELFSSFSRPIGVLEKLSLKSQKIIVWLYRLPYYFFSLPLIDSLFYIF